MADVVIRVRNNGPLLVEARDDPRCAGERLRHHPTSRPSLLCRCGQSAIKPF